MRRARLPLASAFVLLGLPATTAAQMGPAIYEATCAGCHEEASARTPGRATLATLTPEQIVAVLESGVMREQGATLSAAERRAVADFVSATAPAAASASARVGTCSRVGGAVATAAAGWQSWGVSTDNRRFQPEPGFTADEVPGLELKWAFGFEGEASAAVQPTIVGDRVFVPSGSGRIYALGLEDGCLDWSIVADGGVRTALVFADGALYFGDFSANAYKVDARTGQLVWKVKLEQHPAARISGSPVVYADRVYVPMSSIEEVASRPASYPCCTFRGSVSAIDIATGEVAWKSYTIPQEPRPVGTNAAGTQLFAPSGAAVWSPPTIDPETRSVYVATGDAYTQPAAPSSDAVVAFDMETGAIKWVRQMTEGDAYTLACGAPDSSNCPDPEGPDHDFGQPPILVPRPDGGRALVLGQKSGVAHGLDPDREGAPLWETRVGEGGVLGGSEWGSASDGEYLYVAISDLAFGGAGPLGGGPDPMAGGGLHAVRISDGSIAWSAPAPVCGDRPRCSPAQMAPVSAMPGAVFSGALDGILRAYSTADGRVLWSYDTAREFVTVNGVAARGGAIDTGGPAIANGMVLTTSGNGTWGGQRGNVLLAFGVE
jgi:polyvinyl alcohol dehydrogenase (cytochrome)